jgi:hypothetical protein
MRAARLVGGVLGALAAAGCGALLGIEDAFVAPRPDAGDAALDDTAVPCSDTQSDPKNCGRCGHDCLGGACAQGRCRPVVVASGQIAPRALAVRGADVFWVSESRIMTVAVDSRATPSLVATVPFVATRLVAAASGDVFASGAGVVARAVDAGVVAVSAGDAGAPATVPMAADDRSLYFWEPPSIRRQAFAAPSAEAVVSTTDCRDMALGAQHVVWTSASSVARADKAALDGGATPLVVVAAPSRLTTAGGQVYFVDGTTLMRIALDGGPAATLTTCAADVDVVADGERVYCATARGIVRVDLAGAVDVLLTTDQTPVSLALDSASALFTLQGGTDVLRVAK